MPLKNYVLLLIIVLAALLRLVSLSQTPISLYWDEAAIGYNAYSISQTGKDEYGESMPLLFKSFNDYKFPAHIYITAVSVKLFGLNEFGIRFPSAILGTASVYLLYLIIRVIMKDHKTSLQKNAEEYIALISAFVFAISPWHINFSRASFEANTGLFCVMLGIYFLLRSVYTRNYIIPAFVTLGVSLYFYRSLLLFVPLITTVAILIYRKRLFINSSRVYTVVGILVFVLLSVPILYSSMVGEGVKRADQVSVSSEIQKGIEKSSIAVAESAYPQVGNIIQNRRIVASQIFLNNYFQHFSPSFLFFDGDVNGRHGARMMGLLYLWQLPFIIIGLFGLQYISWKSRALIIAWLLFAPIAAGFSLPVPHALRSLNMVPVLSFITALGVFIFIKHWISEKYRNAFIVVGILLITFSLVRFIYLYFFITPYLTNSDWADGYKQLVSYVNSHENKYEKVIVSGYNWQPYIYFLMYNRVSPQEFQENGSPQQFGKYIFGGTSWDREQYSMTLDSVDLSKFADTKNALIVLSPEEYTHQQTHVKKLDEIHDSNGKTVFVVTEL